LDLLYQLLLNSERPTKKARQEDISGASFDEIMEAMNFGGRRKSRKVCNVLMITVIYIS